MENKNDKRGISWLEIIQIVLIMLKFLRVEPVCNYSWWVILSPIWITIVFVLVVAFIMTIVKIMTKGDE